MIIIGDALAERVASWMKADYFPVTRRVFPDGELCPRFEPAGRQLDGETAAIIMQKPALENVNAYFFNYLLLASAAKDAGFSRIVTCMPYFAYARQHKQYLAGEPVSALVAARLLESCGTDSFVTVNAHEPGGLPKLFSIPTLNISVASLLAESISRNPDFSQAAVVAPDDGAEAMARQVAAMLGGRDSTVFEKRRDLSSGAVTLQPVKTEILKGRPVIVVDDMVSSGATMVEAVRACSHHGATKTAALFVHPVFSENALEKLRACCDTIVACNTIESEVSAVDVSPVIAQALISMAGKA